MTGHQPEDPGLRALAGRFPGWEVWRGASGLLYARRHGTRDEPVSGQDAHDLADRIARAQGPERPPPWHDADQSPGKDA